MNIPRRLLLRSISPTISPNGQASNATLARCLRGRIAENLLKNIVRTFAVLAKDSQINQEDSLPRLIVDVDLYRGVPGFFWATWAFIKASGSNIPALGHGHGADVQEDKAAHKAG